MELFCRLNEFRLHTHGLAQQILATCYSSYTNDKWDFLCVTVFGIPRPDIVDTASRSYITNIIARSLLSILWVETTESTTRADSALAEITELLRANLPWIP